MRILLDHCVDIRFKGLLAVYDVSHTKELGWEKLSNGELLSAAETEGFEVFLTTDKNLRFQQNFSKRQLALVTLGSLFTGLDDIAPLAPKVLRLLSAGIEPGTSTVVK